MEKHDDEIHHRHGGGKFPNRSDQGLGLSEFIDSAGVNSRSTSVGNSNDTAPVAAPQCAKSDTQLLALAAAGLFLGFALSRIARR